MIGLLQIFNISVLIIHTLCTDRWSSHANHQQEGREEQATNEACTLEAERQQEEGEEAFAQEEAGSRQADHHRGDQGLAGGLP